MSLSSVIGALRVSLGLDSVGFQQGVAQAQGRMEKFGKRMAFVSAGIAAAATGVALAVKGQIDQADELSKAAQKFGVPIEELSRLAYAADLSDLSLEKLGTGLSRLSRHMADAEQGNSGATEMFTRLGVSAVGANGKLRPTEEVLADIAAVFGSMPDGAQKTALALEIFGKSGADLIPLLNGGAEALQQMTAEADAMGLTLSAETGSAAEQFNDNLTQLWTNLTGVTRELMAAVLPALVALSENLLAAVEWFREWGPAFEPGFAALQRLVELIFSVNTAILSLPDALILLPQFFTDAWEQVKAVTEQWVADFVAIGSAIVDGFKRGITDKWDAMGAWFTAKAEEMEANIKFAFGIQSPSRVFREIGRFITEGLGLGLKDGIPQVDQAMGGLGDAIGGEKGYLESSLRAVGSTAKGVFAGLVSGSMTVQQALSRVADRLADWAINGLFDGLTGGLFGGIGKNANGTAGWRGGWTMVGERMPELVNLPAGTRIMDGQRSRQMLQGGSAAPQTVRVYVDRDGNWQAAVERIAGGVAGGVAAASAQAQQRQLAPALANAQARGGVR